MLSGAVDTTRVDNMSAFEVFIVEGVSALNAVERVCNRRHQRVVSTQGKLLAVNKKSDATIARNERVQRLLNYLSAPDSDACRFSRIIILCDPDIDGRHASVLLINLLRRVRPEWFECKLVFLAAVPANEGSTSGDGRHQCGYPKSIASIDSELLHRHCIASESRRLISLLP